MDYTQKEVLAFVYENDVKFVRLYFCDLFGVQKNISIMPGELERGLQSGISFDGSFVTGFSDATRSDLFLFPDPTTLNVLPWRPQHGRVVRFICDVKNPDKTPFECDTRNFLKNAVKRGVAMGYDPKIGAECEFYLFKTDENGEPTGVPFDEGGYLDIAPLDKGENIRREICLCMEEMGIKPITSQHKAGPGQNEIDFQYSGALNAADNLLTFKSSVKAIAAGSGLFASFLPKPLKEKNGNGLHVNLSLFEKERNIFTNNGGGHSQAAESFIAGILDKAAEITAFLNPLPNSYERFGRFEAPQYVSWSHQNRSQLIRIPAAAGEKTRMELRSPDPSLNPYLGFGLMLHAGLDGIEKGLPLPAPLDVDLFAADETVLKGITPLPKDLGAALAAARQSEFVRRTLGDAIVNKYIALKEQELAAFEAAADQEGFIRHHYFKAI